MKVIQGILHVSSLIEEWRKEMSQIHFGTKT